MDTYKAVLLDFGGTIDTPGVHWADMFSEAYRRFIPDTESKRIYDAYVSAERQLEKERIIGRNDDFACVLRKKTELHLRFIDRYEPYLSVRIHEYLLKAVEDNVEKSKDVLAYLHEKYMVGIISNFYGNLLAVLRAFDLLPFIDICVDSACVNIRKPSTQIYTYALDKLKLAPHQAVMVGDSMKNDIQPATSLGMGTVHLCPGAKTVAPLPHAVIQNLPDISQLM